MLVELADETIATTQQVGACFGFRCQIGNGGSAGDTGRPGNTSVSVGGFNCRPVENESKQQQRQHASIRTVRLE